MIAARSVSRNGVLAVTTRPRYNVQSYVAPRFDTSFMLHLHLPALVLAPMEGVTDAPMRAVQGAVGAFTFAVTEFLRVTQHVPPNHVFAEHMPELTQGCRTPTGLPVQLQLLGGDATRMAETAGRATNSARPLSTSTSAARPGP